MYMYVEIHCFTIHRYSDSEPTIHCDPNAEKSYLSLEELGTVLTGLTDILQRKLYLNLNLYLIFARQPDMHML